MMQSAWFLFDASRRYGAEDTAGMGYVAEAMHGLHATTCAVITIMYPQACGCCQSFQVARHPQLL
jgi:hypothetical protein